MLKSNSFYRYNKAMIKTIDKTNNTDEGKICKQLLQYYGVSYIVRKVSYFHMMEKILDGSSNSFVRVLKLYTLYND